MARQVSTLVQTKTATNSAYIHSTELEDGKWRQCRDFCRSDPESGRDTVRRRQASRRQHCQNTYNRFQSATIKKQIGAECAYEDLERHTLTSRRLAMAVINGSRPTPCSEPRTTTTSMPSSCDSFRKVSRRCSGPMPPPNTSLFMLCMERKRKTHCYCTVLATLPTGCASVPQRETLQQPNRPHFELLFVGFSFLAEHRRDWFRLNANLHVQYRYIKTQQKYIQIVRSTIGSSRCCCGSERNKSSHSAARTCYCRYIADDVSDGFADPISETYVTCSEQQRSLLS
jgi:hypothetical protein